MLSERRVHKLLTDAANREMMTSEQSQDKQQINIRNVVVCIVILQIKQKQIEAHVIQVPQMVENDGHRKNLSASKQI